MLLVNDEGADNINDEHFAVAGVFLLPTDLGEHLSRFPGWRTPTEDEAAAYAAAVATREPAQQTAAKKAPAKKAPAKPSE